VAGGLYTHFIRIAGPSTLEVSLSFQAIIWAIFGGVVTIYGPMAGVFILYPLMEFLRILPQIRTLLFGLTVILILLFMPEGLTTWVRDKIEKECPRCKIRNIATRHTCRVCTAPLD
jgi:branched-chain amino acid transport system permease protein